MHRKTTLLPNRRRTMVGSMENDPFLISLAPDELKPALHVKIDHMSEAQLRILHRVLQQIEMEELAEKIGNDFDRNDEESKFHRIPELVQQFRAEHPY
jgi:hypothetical protein